MIMGALKNKNFELIVMVLEAETAERLSAYAEVTQRTQSYGITNILLQRLN